MQFPTVLKSWWTNILFYGVALGLLLASLQWSQYRLLHLGGGEAWYVGVVAVIFVVVGIWAGYKWQRERSPVSILASAAPQSIQEMPADTGLTPRELEVLQQMALGLSNQEIAARLFVSLNTVKTHVSNLFAKLDVQRRTQAIQRAKERGLLP